MITNVLHFLNRAVNVWLQFIKTRSKCTETKFKGIAITEKMNTCIESITKDDETIGGNI